MKHFGFRVIIALAVLSLLVTACSDQKPAVEKTAPERVKVENLATTPEDIKKEAGDLAKTAMAYTEEQKALYQKKIQEKMAQYSRKFSELEAKLALMNEQAKADLAEEMENLNQKKTEMGLKVRELQAVSGEAYKDLKDGLDRAIDEMDKAYDQALKRFEK